MSDNKKYYYLKLKENFLESETMVLLRNMQDGITYSYILMFLYLKAVKGEGKLMFNDRIPYNANMLASLMGVSVGVVEKAVSIFQELGLVDVLDNGTIYMLDMQDFIGKSSSEADRKRKYRARIEEEKKTLLETKMGQCPTSVPSLSEKRPPEIEIEKEIEKEKEIYKEKSDSVLPKKVSKKHYAEKVFMAEDEYNRLVLAFGEEDTQERIENLSDYKVATGKVYKEDYRAILNWYKLECQRKNKPYVRIEDLIERRQNTQKKLQAEVSFSDKIDNAWREVLSRKDNITEDGWSDPLIYNAARFLKFDENPESYWEYFFKQWYKEDLLKKKE